MTQKSQVNPVEEAERLKTRVQHHYEDEVDPTHKSLLRAWIAFGLTFAVTRAITYGIRSGHLPNMNLATEGLHIHHYVWGIALLLLVGYLALVDDKARFHRPLSIAYGIGAALIIDEFALLLNLRDVYFAEEGRWSVDIALGIVAFLGIYVTAAQFWHSAFREVRTVVRRISRRMVRRRSN